MYSLLLDKKPPKIEDKYPLHNWNNIWENLHFKFIPIRSREIMFKYIHEILPNKCRLKQIRRANDDLCESCDVPETNVHMLYHCEDVILPKTFLLNLLIYCRVGEVNLLRFLFLDISKRNKKLKNTVILLIVLYISSVWYGWKNKRQIIRIYSSSLLSHINLLKRMLGDSIEDLFTKEFCELCLEIINTYL